MPFEVLSDSLYLILSVIPVLGVLFGIWLMSKVEKAYIGNIISAASVAFAVILTLVKFNVFGPDIRKTFAVIAAAMAVGSAAGVWLTKKVKTIQMPQTVALLNGFGGGASALVAVLALFSIESDDKFGILTAMLALSVGTVTLTGSLIAAGKLHGKLSTRPLEIPKHGVFTTLAICGSLIMCIITAFSAVSLLTVTTCFVLSAAFGILFSIRIGGADMPITISLLNSFSGVAGSIAGLALGDFLLVSIGAIVGASGLILTRIMCSAMNRSLTDILLGKTSVSAAAVSDAYSASENSDNETETVKSHSEISGPEMLKSAKDVIIVPGYGMALAQAQSAVKQLADKFEKNGATVRYAIHPVAGRMPGHMNVLLAEVDVDYDKLFEMKDINDDFKNADLTIVVGANDVTNPAAKEATDTPIYGMPVLSVADCRQTIICNFDTKPGYAGVENPLYKMSEVTLLLGDAKESIQKLIDLF